MNPGDLLIRIATFLAAVAFVAALRWSRGREASRRTFRLAYHGMTAALVAASAVLLVAILGHDFRFAYVADYTSRELPLVYLVSAFWAGQQGTYLLWALLGALLGYGLIGRRAWEPACVMACYVPTVGFLLALMLDPGGNPFRLLARAPADGHGLNPLLQDPWMASHPPLVFLGYAAMTVPAVLALAALYQRKTQEWLAPALRWSLVAFVTLGSGIIVGGFWAYKVLGWGGYWGWDPVENASLIPWIAVTALIHAILVQQFSRGLRRISLSLAIVGYVLVLYATFLTRSGVLADFSVHSFPAGSIFRLLVAILLVALVVPTYALLRCKVDPGRDLPVELSWPMLLATAIGLLGISAGLVLIGTSWPLLSSLIGKAASFGPSFYNQASLPIYAALLLILGAAPFLAWTSRPLRAWAPRVAVSLVCATGATLIAVVLGARGAEFLTLFFFAVLALSSNSMRLVEVARNRLLNTGAALAHIGFALMLVGIVASSSWGRSQQAELPLGQPVSVLDHSLDFSGHVEGSEPQDRWRIAIGDSTSIRQAEVALFKTDAGGQSSIFRRPAILRRLAGDLYIAPGALERGGTSETIELAEGAPAIVGDAMLTFLRFRAGADDDHRMAVWTDLVVSRGGKQETVSLPFSLIEGQMRGQPVAVALLGDTLLSLEGMAVERRRVIVRAAGGHPGGVLHVEVSTKPLIGAVWVGTIFLLLGCTVAALRRHVDGKALGANAVPAGTRKTAERARTRVAQRPCAARVGRA